ncbi:uncharacterized protein ACHE_30102A [Aspergillus chevalieri]|uniref:Uncharacterized protein n=1 Tax=Aspergillus chevalieri TaxID=182096 RepID=A0A7R7VK46_ASPCH|nr:uncharacterized protein ACHE_30102A [Aspergillus chevalieri]BCR86115.1 hypothetical protein ACHE_30102A [Aspergillus chevalieri]
MESKLLAHFNCLSLDIREAMWANLPADEDGWWGRKTYKTGLAILRASRTLYNEITTICDSHPQLVFYLTPSPWGWMTISYTAEHHVVPKTGITRKQVEY